MAKAKWLENISLTGKEIYELYDDIRLFEKNNPIVFTVQNKGAKKRRVNLFGANKNRFESNYGNPIVVDIEYEYKSYSYTQLLANTQNAPFVIGLIRLETESANLVANNLDFSATVSSPEGESKTISLPVFRALNQYLNEAVEMDVEHLCIPIDGDTQMQINANGFHQKFGTSHYIKLYFYPSKSSSLKMLINSGTLAKKYTKLQIPLTPNRDSVTTPIDVAYDDKKKRLVA